MAINSNQLDNGFRPLNNFLFKCEFQSYYTRYDITHEVARILEYSVSKITLPKFKESEGKAHSFGSFFIPFPYFSTGEKEMTIEFYETDDMLISKVFYSFLNKSRWKASTLFEPDQCDLMVTVTILDQRNLFGYNSQEDILKKVYYLKTKSLEPPQFARDGSDTDLCRVSVTFNTVEDYNNVYYGGFGSVNEINRRYDEEERKYVDVVDDQAFLNPDDVSNKIYGMFADLNSYFGLGGNGERRVNGLEGWAEAEEKMRRERLNLPPNSSKDFILTDEELNANYKKYKIAREKQKVKYLSKEEFENASKENLRRLGNAYWNVEKKLNAMGYTLFVSEVNDATVGHTASSIKSGPSHVLSQKMDLVLMDKSGNRVKAGELSNEDLLKMTEIFKSEGLTPNYEMRKKNLDEGGTFWIDMQLSSAVGENTNNSGTTTERKYETSWSGLSEIAYMEKRTDGKEHRTRSYDIVTGKQVDLNRKSKVEDIEARKNQNTPEDQKKQEKRQQEDMLEEIRRRGVQDQRDVTPHLDNL